MDRPFVELMERVYHRFKNALFDYYLGSAPAGDEETALVINNYKELIRIQDADQRLLQLVQMAAGGAGIEQVEEFASKDKELEALAKKVTELEQDVFDWKGRFSEKEEARAGPGLRAGGVRAGGGAAPARGGGGGEGGAGGEGGEGGGDARAGDERDAAVAEQEGGAAARAERVGRPPGGRHQGAARRAAAQWAQ